MKNMKNKLIASAVMLAISAVMLTSASFAWFTVSTAPEMTNIKVTMTTQANLEIGGGSDKPAEVTANDSGKVNTWGATLPFADTAVALTQMATVESDGSVKTIKYGADGRTSGTAAAAISGGSYTGATATPATAKDADNRACAAVYDFWLRSNQYTSVTATLSATTQEKMDVYINGTKMTAGTPVTLTLSEDSEQAGRNTLQVRVVVCMDGETHYSGDRSGSFTGKIDFAASGT